MGWGIGVRDGFLRTACTFYLRHKFRLADGWDVRLRGRDKRHEVWNLGLVSRVCARDVSLTELAVGRASLGECQDSFWDGAMCALPVIREETRRRPFHLRLELRSPV